MKTRPALLSVAILMAFAMQGNASDQLALSIGVEPGQFTISQLAQLQAAMADDNQSQFDFLLESFTSGSAQISGDAGVQLARSLGVEPGRYTLSQLAAMKGAQD